MPNLDVVPPQAWSGELLQLPHWPRAFGGPTGQGKIRCRPDDFIVHEQLAFEPSGSGEHVFLHIEKVGENTEYVVRALARFAGVRQRDIGYAGLKDRHARTRQWFSVWLPGKDDPCWEDFATDTIKILQCARHNKKLKRGVLVGNDFSLVIRDWQGDRTKTNTILEAVKAQGLPNYFGEQRFGINEQNLTKASAMFRGAKVNRQQRSLYLSAVRSFLFNQILAERIRQNNWNRYITGDALIFDKSRSFFKTDTGEQELDSRVDSGEVHPTGLLYGLGDNDTSGQARDLEQAVCDQHPLWFESLRQAKVESARRPLRIHVEKLKWQFSDANTLTLNFSLPAGSFATSLLTEIITQERH